MAGADVPTQGIVLVVDDDADVSEALREVLSDHGLQVFTAPHGEQALKLLRQGLRPHLILLDLMMPRMDGWAFRAAQKADAQLSSIPVVLLSAHKDALALARQLEVDEALRKPVDLEPLLNVVDRFVFRSGGGPHEI